jgi:hypothetical protein
MKKDIVASYSIDDIIWADPENMPVIVTECRVNLTRFDNKWGWDAMYDNVKTILEERFGGPVESFEMWEIDDNDYTD